MIKTTKERIEEMIDDLERTLTMLEFTDGYHPSIESDKERCKNNIRVLQVALENVS